jgi:protein-S-isoprenylcysteine O-methyltransferase Ste14
MRTFVLAYALLAIFIASERLLRQGDEAISLEESEEDRGTTRLVGAAYGVSINAGLLAPVLSRAGIGRISNPRPATAGVMLMVVGLALKVWAMRTLGRFYTRTLRTASDQVVVEGGPYRFLRHPGYLGAIMMWSGFGLATRNWLLAAAVSLAMMFVYRRRIAFEESMLAHSFGPAYAGYQRRTARLVPGVY